MSQGFDMDPFLSAFNSNNKKPAFPQMTYLNNQDNANLFDYKSAWQEDTTENTAIPHYIKALFDSDDKNA
jgi:hypothetical protein